MIPIPIIGTAISAISGFFTKKQEIKQATVTAKAKLDQTRLDGAQKIELTDAEWEALSVQTQNNSWKDEYITLVITLPIVAVIIGSLLSGLGIETGKEMVTGAINGIKELKNLGMDYGLVLNAVVFAAVGLKLWRA